MRRLRVGIIVLAEKPIQNLISRLFQWKLIVIMAVCAMPAGNAIAELRDPFISIIELEKQKLVEQKAIDLSNVTLKGILWNEAKRVAIINDELLMPGDAWRDFRIEKIEKDSIIISSEGKDYTLSLGEGVSPDKKEEPVKETNQLSLPGNDPRARRMMGNEGEREWR